jgi:arylsulfatase A-like enzyme
MGFGRGFGHYEYRAPCDYLNTAWGDRFIKRLSSSHYRQPWFLMLHLFELHKPRRIPAEHDSPEYGRNRYERAVSSLDEQLGRVFSAAGEDSLIVVTGDHGEKTEEEIFREGTAVTYARKILKVDEAEGMPLYRLAYWAGPSVLQQIYNQLTPVIQEISLHKARQKLTFGRWSRMRDKLRLLWLIPRFYPSDLFKIGVPLKQTAMLKKRSLLDEGRARRKVEKFVKFIGKDKLLDMQMRMWVNSYKNNMREGHGMHVYDYLVRVPLVMRCPQKLPAGAVSQRMVRQPDILPTILDLVGINPGQFKEIDGCSFKPLIEGKPWQLLPAYVSVTGAPADLELRGVRTEEYKYTFGPYNPELPEELYDLRQDPGEEHNLAAEKRERCLELRDFANSFVPVKREVQAEQITVNAKQQKHIEEKLRDLGYIE